MIVRDAAMASVLTLGDNEIVGGYCALDGYSEGAASWDIDWHSAPRVDDDFERSRRRGKRRITLPVLMKAASRAACEALQDALLDAVEDVDRWYLDVRGDGSVMWACSSVDYEPPRLFGDGSSRILTLSIPASPGRGI